MISEKHKFIFLHPPKTAGTSLHYALIKYSEDSIITDDPNMRHELYSPFFAKPEHRRGNETGSGTKHTHLWRYYDFEDFDNFLKIGSIRNPWARAVSWYFFENPDHTVICKKRFRDRLCNEWGSMWEYFTRENHMKYNHKEQEWVRDESLELVVDHFVRFESLQDDFNGVCDLLDIPRKELPHYMRSKSRYGDYRDHCDEEIRDLVEKVWQRDIEEFSYKFDE